MSRPQESTSGLMAEALSGLGRLVRGELALARAEATEGLKSAAGGLGKLVVAGIMGLVGLNVLAGAAVVAVAEAGLGTGWASLLVGLGLVLLGLGFAQAGKSALSPTSLWPRRSLRNLDRDTDTLKSALTTKEARHV